MQRTKIVKQNVISQAECAQTLRKPLSSSNNSNNKRSAFLKKIIPHKTVSNPKIKAHKITYEKDAVKSAKEILTDDKRFENQLKSSKLFSGSNTYVEHNIRSDISIYELDSKSSEISNEYKLAPLTISPSQKSVESVKIAQNLSKILYSKKRSMPVEEIELVKDVLKSDKRCKRLDKNPKLFREILETQLEKILKHELAVKNALDCLESSSNIKPIHSIESPKFQNQIVNYSNFNTDSQKLEVDVVFKNVPSLKKEIAVLRALGEKLEETLKCTTFHREKLDSKPNDCLTTDNLSPNMEKSVPRFCQVKYEKYIACSGKNIMQKVRVIGILYVIGIVKEFHVVEKTIFELKQDAKRPFYIPDCTDVVELKKTSFERLANNPDKLLRYLKPKNCEIAFNVLEQDSIFFNSLFNKTFRFSGIPIDIYDKGDYCENNKLRIIQTFHKGGDSQLWKKKTQRDNTKNIEHNLNDTIGCKNMDNLEDQSNKSECSPKPIICYKKRRSIKRYLTPMPIDNYYSPKNSLIKTMLVGLAQMSVFIIFMMALTYPDIVC